MKFVKIISMSLIFALVISAFTSSYGDVVPLNLQQNSPTKLIENPTDVKLTKEYTVRIDERNLKVVNQEVTATLTQRPITEQTTKISMFEEVTLSNGDELENQIHLLKHNFNQAILERIFNKRKFKLDKSIGIPLSIDTILSLYGNVVGPLYSNTAGPLSKDFDKIPFEEQDILVDYELDLTESQPVIESLIQNSFDDFDELIQDITDSLEQQSTTLLFIFAIAAFYVIVRSENPKIQIQTYKRLLSFGFILILLSSALISPLSISSSYYAYAQTDQNSTNPQTEGVIQESSQPSNNTQVLPQANIIRYDYDVSTDNATLPTIPDLNATLPVIVPNATKSWGTNSTDLELVGGVYVNQTGLIIEEGFIKSPGNYTNQTSALTVAAWIKPVYAGGSSIFTIISKDKSFELTLNNAIYPQHTAAFSVFDGIKWNKIESTTEIGEGWSHVTATFNGTDISIYVNGTVSNTAKTVQTITISSKGSTENTTPQVSNTASNIVIGASLNAREIDTAQQAFSGTLDQVQIYDVYLTADQIFELYQKTLPLILEKLIPPVIEQIKLEPINLLNQTQVNGTINANVTEPVILPTQTTKNQFTIISWITPNYTNASDEYTVVSKEKSFALSVNNFIPPQHTPKFSVFDGIHWIEQFGTSRVESRTHLAAVVNGTKLFLYVNGTLESKATLPQAVTLVDGSLVPIPAEVASSDNSIVIGAYLSTIRSEPSINNKFFGSIDELVLHPYALSEDEIRALYMGQVPQATDISLSESLGILDLVGFEATNQTITVGLQMMNMTVAPVVNAKPSYLINEDIEIQLEYLDQYAVLTNELAKLDNALSEIIPQTEQSLGEIEAQIVNGSQSIEVDQTQQEAAPVVDQTPQEAAPVVDQTPQNEITVTNQTPDSASETEQNSTGVNLNIAGYMIFPFIPVAHANDVPESYVGLEQILATKEKIQELKERISELKQGQNVTETTISEIKAQIKSVSDSLKSVSDSIPVQPQDEQINNLAQTLDTVIEENATKVQHTEWRDQNNTITVQIFDSQGTLVQTISEYEKIRDGKFNIRLSPQETVVPGMYSVKTTLQIDGNQYSLEDEFAWGLVSLNTKKSIYKPGETADFVIVVLDNQGHPICDSDLSMTITDPQNQNTTLTSQNGITKNADCGLYDSQYRTNPEGNYTVNISATTPNGATSFSTYFAVKESFDYDIIRTAQSKIDPINYPNSFNVNIDIESYVGGDQIIIHEHVPAVFDLVTDGIVTQVNNTKTITWQRTLDESNNTNVSYSYSIPTLFPRLYALGKVEIVNTNSTFTEARNWYVAADPAFLSEEEGIVTYRGADDTDADGVGLDQPKFKIFSAQFGGGNGGFDEEHTLPSTGSPINFTKVVYSNYGRILLVTQSFDGFLDSYHCDYNCTDTNNWTQNTNIASVFQAGNLKANGTRKFDVEFEPKNGRALLVFDRNDTANAGLAFRVLGNESNPSWNATTDINDNTANTAGDQHYTWISLDPNPLSTTNTILVSALNVESSDTTAFIWNGQRFGSFSSGVIAFDLATSFGDAGRSPTSTYPAFDLKWTTNGTNAIFVSASSTNANDLVIATLSNTGWSAVTNHEVNPTTGIPKWVNLYRDIFTNRMMLTVEDGSGDIHARLYDQPTIAATANTWRATNGDLDTSVDEATGDTRNVAFAWNATNLVLGPTQRNAGSNGKLIYDTDGGTAGFTRRNCQANCTGAPASGQSTVPNTGSFLSLYTYPYGSSSIDMIGIRSDTSRNLQAFFYNSNTATEYTPSGAALSAETESTRLEHYSFAFRPVRLGNYTMSLTENLGMNADTVASLIRTEKLGIRDNLVKTTTKVLTERLGIQDNLVKSTTTQLTEKLGVKDVIAATSSITLTEKLGLRDRQVVLTTTKVMTENLGVLDTTVKSTRITLTEKLGIADQTTKSTALSLTEKLGITDNTTTTTSRFQSLTENLGITDQTARSTTVVLTEKLGIADQTTKSTALSLTEKLGITDQTARSTTVVLTEKLGITDNTTTTTSRFQSLTENLGITDQTASSISISLTERLGVKDSVLFKGGIKIEARDLSDSLIGGATYTISPNPFGGSSLTVSDNGGGDSDPTSGRVKINTTSFGTYHITMSTIPTAYNVLGNSTLVEVHNTQNNGTAIFKVTQQSMDLSTMPPTAVSSPPALNSTVYNRWTNTYAATIVNGTSSQVITSVNGLLPIISVGNATSQLDDAILKQGSIQLNVSFPVLTPGQTVIDTMAIQNYSIPQAANLTSVIPSIVTSPVGAVRQFVATPPLNMIVDGQTMVVPVDPNLLPAWGGLVQLTVDSRDGATPMGIAPDEWFVVETSPAIPTGITANGIAQNNINLFLDIKYEFEENGVGFDWSNPNNHATDPILKVRVAKSSSLISDGNGCPIMTGYTFDTGMWTQSGVTISNVQSISATSCELDLTVEHFSRFSLASQQSSSSSGSSGSSGSSVGGGRGGGSSGQSGSTAGAGFGGKLVQPIIIYEIAYDVCESNAAKITVGATGSEALPPSVKIRTPIKAYNATLAEHQPYAEVNKALSTSRYVYEAPLDPKINFFIVTAEQTGSQAAATTYLVNIDECRNTITVNQMDDIERETGPKPIIAGMPNIFDVKFQVNENKPMQATAVNPFVKPQDDLKVSAIIDSPSSLRRAELRVSIAGENYSNYVAVKMDIAPLQNMTNVYVVSADIPPSFLRAPAIVYWIHVINDGEKIQSSDRYSLGVKPAYDLDARMELDSLPSKAQGTTYRPIAYVYNNGQSPLFGTVSLLVNDVSVYTSPAQIFNNGQSVVALEWNIPEAGIESNYPIKAKLSLYDKDIETAKTILKTFPTTKVFAISEPISASSIMDEKETVAQAGLMYSSDDNRALHYRVVAPDGTCVIGKSDSCAVKDSTAGHRGNIVSIDLGGQIYRVRYSGQDNPLERFSITSVDPIVGTWSVTLESDDGIIPEAHAFEDVMLKVKYKAVNTKLVTVTSDNPI